MNVSVEPHDHVFEPARVVVSVWVLRGVEPVRVVVHHSDDDWSVLCGTVDSPEDLQGVPLSWLSSRRDIGRYATELGRGRMVTRDDALDAWQEEPAPD
ncbi:hypothetical protein [Modestobacter sp. SYSU DS0290]